MFKKMFQKKIEILGKFFPYTQSKNESGYYSGTIQIGENTYSLASGYKSELFGEAQEDASIFSQRVILWGIPQTEIINYLTNLPLSRGNLKGGNHCLGENRILGDYLHTKYGVSRALCVSENSPAIQAGNYKQEVVKFDNIQPFELKGEICYRYSNGDIRVEGRRHLLGGTFEFCDEKYLVDHRFLVKQ